MTLSFARVLSIRDIVMSRMESDDRQIATTLSRCDLATEAAITDETLEETVGEIDAAFGALSTILYSEWDDYLDRGVSQAASVLFPGFDHLDLMRDDIGYAAERLGIGSGGAPLYTQLLPEASLSSVDHLLDCVAPVAEQLDQRLTFASSAVYAVGDAVGIPRELYVEAHAAAAEPDSV